MNSPSRTPRHQVSLSPSPRHTCHPSMSVLTMATTQATVPSPWTPQELPLLPPALHTQQLTTTCSPGLLSLPHRKLSSGSPTKGSHQTPRTLCDLASCPASFPLTHLAHGTVSVASPCPPQGPHTRCSPAVLLCPQHSAPPQPRGEGSSVLRKAIPTAG